MKVPSAVRLRPCQPQSLDVVRLQSNKKRVLNELVHAEIVVSKILEAQINECLCCIAVVLLYGIAPTYFHTRLMSSEYEDTYEKALYEFHPIAGVRERPFSRARAEVATIRRIGSAIRKGTRLNTAFKGEKRGPNEGVTSDRTWCTRQVSESISLEDSAGERADPDCV